MKLECGRYYKIDDEECVLLGISKHMNYLEFSLEHEFNSSNYYTSTVAQTDEEINGTLNEYLLVYMEFMPVKKLDEQYISSNVISVYGSKRFVALDKKLDIESYLIKNKLLNTDFDGFFDDETIQKLYQKYYDIIRRNRDTVDLNEYFNKFYCKNTENMNAELYFDASTLKYYVRRGKWFYFIAKANSSNIKDIFRGRYIAEEEKRNFITKYEHTTKSVQLEEKDLYALCYATGEIDDK